jgi:hypothetical protein
MRHGMVRGDAAKDEEYRHDQPREAAAERDGRDDQRY